MKRLLNAGSGKPLGSTLLQWIKEWGFDGIRQDIPLGAPAEYITTLIQEVADAQMTGCFIVGGWCYWDNGNLDMRTVAPDIPEAAEHAAQVAALMQATSCRGFVNVGNEPDITESMSEERFVELCQSCLDSMRSVVPLIEMITGGVHNISRNGGFKYLEKCVKLGLPTGRDYANVFVGVHPYRTGLEPWEPFEGDSMSKWADRIYGTAGPFAIDEVGWHSAPQTKGRWPCKKQFRFSFDDIKRFAKWEQDHWLAYGAQLYVWYQINDGPLPEFNMHNYGVRTFPDEQPKPVIEAFRNWSPPL
jgi:hypothetical protein